MRQKSEALRNETIRLVEDRLPLMKCHFLNIFFVRQIKTTRTQAESSNRLNDRARDVARFEYNKERQK